jgi:hypothetical protein
MTSRPTRASEGEGREDLVRAIARLDQWQSDHEKDCATRYAEIGKSVQRVEGSISGLRRDIGRIHDVLLKAPVAAPPLAAPFGPSRRSRIEVAKDLVQIVFQVVGTISGLGVVLWVGGAALAALGQWLEHLSGNFPHR